MIACNSYILDEGPPAHIRLKEIYILLTIYILLEASMDLTLYYHCSPPPSHGGLADTAEGAGTSPGDVVAAT